MGQAFFWGLIAAGSLVIGGLLACWITLGNRALGAIMAFGAGVLLSAVAYELVFEAIQLGKGTGRPTLGFFTGAFTFLLFDWLIGRMGSSDRKDPGASHASALVVPLVLGIVLDGIPESVVIGLGILEGGAVSVAMLVAVFVSNIPEAMASTAGMRAGGWRPAKILGLWIGIALVCAVASAAGYLLLGDVAPMRLSFVQAFAGGAILMMLANTMMPEAFEHSGRLAGVFTVLGFAAAVWIVVLEHTS